MEQLALNVENAVKAYRSRKRIVAAVDGASFSVKDGEIFGLLGMNGAGKSTVIKMCTGLLDPDGGRITVFGRDVTTEREQAKSLINVSPQETAVAPALSVRENLQLIGRLYGADKQSAKLASDGMLDALGLFDRANDRAGKLSGGLMRRLSIGMALITEPRLVFLDEPTLGLDVVARRELHKLIRARKANASIVFTTHYLEEAKALCDRIAIMAHGKITAIGTVAELEKLSGETDFERVFLALAGETEQYE